MQQLKRFLADQAGATAIEYSMIAGLIAAVIVAVVTSTGSNLQARFAKVSSAVQ